MPTRRAAIFLVPLAVIVVVFVGACAAPNPSPSPSVTSTAPVVSTAPSTPVTSAPSVAPTSTPTAVAPTPTPVAVLPKRGPEVFDAGEGVWKIAASTDNLGKSGQTFVHRLLGDEAKVFVACVGTGRVHVTVDAVKDANSPGVSLVDELVECPNDKGEFLSLSTSVPVGWSANPDAAPSNDSIRYQVLVGTIVP